ncbi:MAG: LamG-like jellyroll fold domain-containing protein [Luteolibacter sp.]
MVHCRPLPFSVRRIAVLIATIVAISAPALAKPFVHPGLLHTEADFERMKTKVAAGEEPWLSGWKKLDESHNAQLGWSPRPVETVIRGGPGQNFPLLFNDIHAAYQLAVRWKVSGDVRYADKSVEILNAWSSKLKAVQGNADRFLAAGIYGYQFANVAEIMRTYRGWNSRDFARFQKMMIDVFYPMNQSFLFGRDGGKDHNGAAITNYWANWDLCNMASLQAIGVLCDRPDLYDQALKYFRYGRGNGAMDKAVYYVHPGYLGQWQESGRDQGHNTLGIALMGPFLETAWNQGADLYAYDNNRFLAGAEYIAKYNLGERVPFQAYEWGTGPHGDRREQTQISSDQGTFRMGYELVVNHYVHRGIAAPWSERYAAKLRPEGVPGGHASSFDQFGLGTLTDTIDPQVKNPVPSGLTARKASSGVVLSWWGAAGADSYSVKRAPAPDAPVTILASGIKDPLTFTDTAPLPGANYYLITGMRAGVPTLPSNVAVLTMKPSLVAHYTFDASSGSSARDETGKNNGILQRGATWDQGKIAKAILLDGKDGHVTLPVGIGTDLSDFTIAAWVRIDSEKAWMRVSDFGDDRGNYMFLTPRGANGKARFAISTTYGYNEQVIDAGDTFPKGEWAHLAVTLSGKTGTLYLNGVAVGTNSAIDFPPFQLGKTDRNWLGRSQFPSDPFFAGAIDDLRIYDGTLTAKQIAVLAGK